MDVFDAYAYSTAGWMVFQALSLLISPKLSIAVLSPESRGPTSTLLIFNPALRPSADIFRCRRVSRPCPRH